jgi:hypothetical protein
MKTGLMERTFPDWVLDVTNYEPGVQVWCPYDAKREQIIVGITFIGECPGKKTGAFHIGGQEALETTLNLHPGIELIFKSST